MNSSATPPTKTFGVTSPTRLLFKLEFDAARLHQGRTWSELQYAALDCAVWNWHMVDWVLNVVEPQHYLQLTGKARPTKPEEELAGRQFATRNADRIPDLETCRLIANTGKHFSLRRGDDPRFTTDTSVRFEPPIEIGKPIPEGVVVTPLIVIVHAPLWSGSLQGEVIRRDALQMFKDLARNWRSFLMEEGLLDHGELPPNDEKGTPSDAGLVQ